MDVSIIKLQNKRDASLDAVCGLFIIYMIMTHAFQWSNTFEDDFYMNCRYFLFMFMAWFFYKSGMFHKKDDLYKVTKHNAKKLIIPFIVYTIVGEIVYAINLYQNHLLTWGKITIDPIIELVFKGSMNGNLALWFLLTLFLVKVIMAVTDKYRVKYLSMFICSSIVAWGGGYCFSLYSSHPIFDT